MQGTNARAHARQTVQEIVNRSRLALAAKSAVAAAIAWYLAPLVPFAESEYSYYAPLGVLVSMYPTFFESARSGMQTVLGLVAGVALGLGGVGLVAFGSPGIVAVALVVAVGVAVGGAQLFGAGRDWVSMAGLFVLLLSRGESGEFSSSYLVTMGFGVVVGLAVQWIAVPPLYGKTAQVHVAEYRAALAAAFRAAASTITEGGGEQSIREAEIRVRVAGDAVRQGIDAAARSERANPRVRFGRAGRSQLGTVAGQLDAVQLQALVVSDLAARCGSRGTAAAVGAREEGAVPLRGALVWTARLLETGEPGGARAGAQGSAERGSSGAGAAAVSPQAAARSALRRYATSKESCQPLGADHAVQVAVAVSVGRALDALADWR
ncbi:hypothetical protein ACIFOC_00202 [Leucobacter aridicollis]